MAILIAVIAIGLGVPFGFKYVAERYGCAAAWADSGMSSRYSFFGGCQIQLKDGTWIPSSRYREMGQ